MTSPRFRRWSWLVIGALVFVSLIRAGVTDGDARTADDRARAIAETIKCPTCRSQSVAGSDSAAARAIRTDIARRLEDGQSADQIRAAIAGTYGDDVLLTPGRSGVEGLVWVLPVVAVVVGLAGVSFVIARWRGATSAASDADRALVAAALAAAHEPNGDDAVAADGDR